MDMGVIKRKLENGAYTCAKECVDDYRQMFNNCYLYNKTTDVSSLLCGGFPSNEVYLCFQ